MNNQKQTIRIKRRVAFTFKNNTVQALSDPTTSTVFTIPTVSKTC